MIKNVMGGGFVQVNCYQGNMPYISPGAQGAGIMRYNTNLQKIEVYDGVSWLELGGGYANIELSPVVTTAVNWVMDQMAKEAQMKELAKKHASVQHALDNVELAKQELELIYQLAKDHTNDTTAQTV
jgi:hypothetical protein